MFEILLIRHAETDNNKNGRFTGLTDVSINANGREQARKLAVLLKEDVVDTIYSSDLKRCVETGEHIHCSNVIYTEHLREMNFGCWEGLTYDEIKKKYPDEADRWESEWYGFVIPEGETFENMSGRVLREFEAILKMQDYQNNSGKIAIISHSGCIRTILGNYIIGSVRDCWRFQIDNASVSRMCIKEDYFYLKSLNEKLNT